MSATVIHYRKAQEDRVCRGCGCTYTPDQNCRNQLYCTTRCRQEHHARRARERRKAVCR